MFSTRKVKRHIGQRKSINYTTLLLVAKKSVLSEVQRYVFGSMFKHQLTRDNTFALIRSYDNEVYVLSEKVERRYLRTLTVT